MIFSGPWPGMLACVSQDRKADMVGVGLNDLPQTMRLEELALVGGEMERHGRPPIGTLGGGDGKAALAVRRPQPGRGFARPSGQHVNPVRDHESGIEADAELTDQRQVLLCIAGKLSEKGLGSGAGDGAQRIDQLLPVHADAVVFDRQAAPVLVDDEANSELGVTLGQMRVHDRLVAKAVTGVRSVRNQLAEKNLLMGVEGVGNDVE